MNVFNSRLIVCSISSKYFRQFWHAGIRRVTSSGLPESRMGGASDGLLDYRALMVRCYQYSVPARFIGIAYG